MWEKLKEIHRFMPLSDVFRDIKVPIMKIENRPLYYLGEGVLISFSERQFIVEDFNRKEVGIEGEYALNLFYFSDVNRINKHFNTLTEFVPFMSQPFIIDHEISIGNSALQVAHKLKRKEIRFESNLTRKFNNGIYDFYSNVINFYNYQLLFFSEDKQATLEAFSYTFKEIE
ncbi:hypothetical protein [Paenibacillus sp. PAMC21692]|uniref:hypothetical protein n=1 Tax=Paenibacillus sp. PAMC21692 TaxID=2762320 RepID=UPI00164E0EEF|nr:hypothetical protein [Paenibacillus sp. PAMC21692]QNK55156.1 hypothetical protein H7F31_21325 [Paenibacillus sp. PAMC21692]